MATGKLGAAAPSAVGAGAGAGAAGALGAGAGAADAGAGDDASGFMSLVKLRLLSLKITIFPSRPVSLTSAMRSRSGASPNWTWSACSVFQEITGSALSASTTLRLLTSAEPL
ncbi:MAG: hypothetical protein DMD81_19500 [Candidatus Rokuibacteriota bacterium]|nr:MAG: hypothetical protein DMD81_19500 [Candidatus Rokubacteria bacterium]